MTYDIKIKNRKDNKKGGNRKPQTYRHCVICGKVFGPLKRLSQICCSKECGYKLRSQNGSKKKGKHYLHLKRAERRVCPICEKVFWGKNDRNGRFGSEKIRIQRYCSHGCYMKSRLETTIERLMKEFLIKQGIKFEQEYKIGKYWVDFYVPEMNLCIEVDGNYWHSLEKQVERDKRKDDFLRELGYNILRIKEDEILNQVIIDRWEQFTGKKAERVDYGTR